MIVCQSVSASAMRTAPRTLLVLGVLTLPFLPGLAATEPRDNPDQVAPVEPAHGGPVANKPVPGPAMFGQSANTGSAAKVAQGATPNSDDRVRVSHPISQEVGEFVDISEGGYLESPKVSLRTRIGGQIVQVRCRLGEAVKTGQVLFEVDPATYKVMLDKAEAEVRRARAQVSRWAAEMDFARIREKTIPTPEGGRLFFQARAEREEAEAALQAAQADRDLAKLNLEATQVKSPIDGVVSKVMVEPGETVTANTGDLARILSLDPLHVDFYIDVVTARFLDRAKGGGKMKAGVNPEIPIRIAVSGDAGFPHRGLLDFVDPEVQPPNDMAIHCRATIPNPDRSLTPGTRVGIRLVANARHKALLVPMDCLMIEPNGAHGMVYVIDAQNRVELRMIRPGIRSGGLREIVEGLKPDDWVVVRHAKPIKPGEKVVVERLKSLAGS